jgi:hypothetical protein
MIETYNGTRRCEQHLKTPKTLDYEAFPHKFHIVHGTIINYSI